MIPDTNRGETPQTVALFIVSFPDVVTTFLKLLLPGQQDDELSFNCEPRQTLLSNVFGYLAVTIRVTTTSSLLECFSKLRKTLSICYKGFTKQQTEEEQRSGLRGSGQSFHTFWEPTHAWPPSGSLNEIF